MNFDVNLRSLVENPDIIRLLVTCDPAYFLKGFEVSLCKQLSVEMFTEKIS